MGKEQRKHLRPVKIKIVQMPLFTDFAINERIMFYGLLCKVIYEDGSFTYLENPRLEYVEADAPGTYKATIYLDKKHSYGIKKSFKFHLWDRQREIINKENEKCEL